MAETRLAFNRNTKNRYIFQLFYKLNSSKYQNINEKQEYTGYYDI